MLFARYPHCWGAQLLAKKLCVIFQVRAQSITKATLPGRPHREKLSSPYQPRCAPSTVHCQGLSPTSSQALTGICIPAPGTFIQRPFIGPSSGTSAKPLYQGERGNLEDTYSLLWLSASPLLAFSSCFPIPQAHETVRAFCSGSPDTTPSVLIHLTADQCCSIGKMEQGELGLSPV